ncbi:hypothetical protein [Hymenobacter arizonensis]|uniref:Uncharacterized protein n=1 Tax=Hymenobacter arizonensis TaxID=1227077 RepID=A0A1I6BQV0_HYMAR|nr:hypothetical protein [Hymenobacter arizonensis]SFQ83291.1 hypothetical protein SAMN04515668_4941 [Hymenobacter arizonensis]
MDDHSVGVTLDLINARVKASFHLEADIHSFANNRLTVVVGEDLTYSYDFQVVFEDVFTVSLNSSFRIETLLPWLSIIPVPACIEVNVRFGVETGNTLFQLHNEDNLFFFVAAGSISYVPTGGKLWPYH